MIRLSQIYSIIAEETLFFISLPLYLPHSWQRILVAFVIYGRSVLPCDNEKVP